MEADSVQWFDTSGFSLFIVSCGLSHCAAASVPTAILLWRARLRSMAGFSQALREDYGSSLDATAQGLA